MLLKNQIVFLLLMIISACINDVSNDHHTFFSLKDYFAEQKLYLQKNNFRLRKKIMKGNAVEEKLFSHPNWQNELTPFATCDINKTGWALSYSADTLQIDSLKKRIIYKAKEDRLQVKQIEIVYEKGAISYLSVLTSRSNSYFAADMKLEYYPGKGSTITGGQHVMLADSIQYTITSEYLK